MPSRKTGELERKWITKGGRKFEEFFASGEKHGLTKTEIGDVLGYKRTSRIQSVTSLMQGKTTLSPDHIIKISGILNKYLPPPLPENDKNRYEIEALLASYCGRLMPTLINDLSETELDRTLELLSRFMCAAHELALNISEIDDVGTRAWPLLTIELENMISGWRTIFEVEKIFNLFPDNLDDSQKSVDITVPQWKIQKWKNLERLLNEIDSPLQLAYAHVSWAWLSARGGVTIDAQNSAKRALEAIDRLKGNVGILEGVLSLKHRAHVILGDSYRATSNYEDSLEQYKLANDCIQDSALQGQLSFRITIKEFNTYLLAGVMPPNNMLNRIQLLARDEKLDNLLRSRAYYALAHYERSQRGNRLIEAARYGVEGLDYAKKSGDRHREAVGHQYLGETLLRLGCFSGAIAEFTLAFEGFKPHHHGRLGFTKFMQGRATAYLALRNLLREGPKASADMKEALLCFEEANSAFQRAFDIRGMSESGQQKKYLLTELAKWEAINLAVNYRRENLNRERIEYLLYKCRDRLQEAKRLLPLEERRDDSIIQLSKIQVNELFIDFVEWYLLRLNEHLYIPKLEESIRRMIRTCTAYQPAPKGFPNHISYFRNALRGNCARLYAMIGVIRINLGLLGRNHILIGEEDIKESIEHAKNYDFQSLLDCRLIVNLGVGFDSRESVRLFDTNLDDEHKVKLRRYLLTGSIGAWPNKDQIS